MDEFTLSNWAHERPISKTVRSNTGKYLHSAQRLKGAYSKKFPVDFFTEQFLLMKNDHNSAPRISKTPKLSSFMATPDCLGNIKSNCDSRHHAKTEKQPSCHYSAMSSNQTQQPQQKRRLTIKKIKCAGPLKQLLLRNQAGPVKYNQLNLLPIQNYQSKEASQKDNGEEPPDTPSFYPKTTSKKSAAIDSIFAVQQDDSSALKIKEIPAKSLVSSAQKQEIRTTDKQNRPRERAAKILFRPRCFSTKDMRIQNLQKVDLGKFTLNDTRNFRHDGFRVRKLL